MNGKTERLKKDFYTRDTIEVAHALLGCILVHESPQGKTSGMITETEAYLGIQDPACHSFGERKTPRVQSMYLDGGHAYVYLIYGLHCCFNVVTMNVNVPEAVLIRAVKPLEGFDLMTRRRGVPNAQQLTNGPGKLCEAFGITRDCDGLDLVKSQLYLCAAPEVIRFDEIQSSGRIGIGYAGDDAHAPLRFQLLDRTSG